MAARRRGPFTPVVAALRARFPDLAHPELAIREHRVIADGRVVENPRSLVRRDAAIRVLPARRLRGDRKLSTALDAFQLELTGAVAVDVGAAAGGFTTALLRRGAARVYAVDTGFGQLTGALRHDPRVVDLERTNVADLDRRTIPERVDVVTVDLSYTPVAAIVDPLATLDLSTDARLVALVKPTFELRADRLVTDPRAVRRAIDVAVRAVDARGWTVRATTLPTVTGRRGAIEAFVLAEATAVSRRHRPW